MRSAGFRCACGAGIKKDTREQGMGKSDKSDKKNRGNKNPVFLVFLVFPLGRPSRPFFFATFGGKSGAKATHHISGGGESRKA